MGIHTRPIEQPSLKPQPRSPYMRPLTPAYMALYTPQIDWKQGNCPQGYGSEVIQNHRPGPSARVGLPVGTLPKSDKTLEDNEAAR
jgi:hypothetical protein